VANPPTQKKQITINPLTLLVELVKLCRPLHWTKNFALFAAIIFAGSLFDRVLFGKVVWAFLSFNLITSATYIFNDIMDAERDRLHPFKKFRPIAAGKIPVSFAVFVLIFLILLSLWMASSLNTIFLILVLVYLVIQIAYSLGLKNIATLDIIIIASGFIVRVYSGAFVIDAHLSVWFLLCVISVALFLASGKRRAELGTISEKNTRISLSKYRRELLNSYVTMFGNAAWMSWSLFTFFESPPANRPIWLFLAEISRTTTINKLLMITTPVVIFGIMRYESLIFENRSESPEKLLLTDRSLIVSVLLWLGLVVAILYGGLTLI
jgi:4-hydroxybenzoate polyprenyltransferase